MPRHHAVAAHLFQSNSMRIASWNVNSVKARLDIIINWLKSDSCDVLLLQETKSQDENFPHEAFSSIGWHVAIHGQKSYNGVAIASRHQIDDVLCGLPGDDTDEQARYIEASIQNVRVASIYLPNGNPAPGPKFDYKLQWMDRLNQRAATLLATEQAILLGGDFNVIPADMDCYDPLGWDGDALTRPETRQAFHRLTHAGYCDAPRARATRMKSSIPIGITKLGRGNVIMGCGLTICYYPPKLLTALARLVLTKPLAVLKNHQTTPRYGVT